MHWLTDKFETPQLLSISGLEDGEYCYVPKITDSHHHALINKPVSMKKSLKEQSSSPLIWSTKKHTKSTENCYNIQEGKIVERITRSRYVSPIRFKNKNTATPRSSSSVNQSITDKKSISPLPTQSTQSHSNSLKQNWRILQRETDKGDLTDDLENCSEKVINKLSRTIGNSSIPYREKRNPLYSTRLSCYKPVSKDTEFDYQNLKNCKSFDDLDRNYIDLSSTSMFSFVQPKEYSKMNSEDSKETKVAGNTSESVTKIKRNAISSKFRSMTGKTQRLFSKIYSNTKQTEDTSSDICNDFVLRRPVSATNATNCRRSLSYGTLTEFSELSIKKLTAEDGDSGILVNGSGASSMVDTDSCSDDIKSVIRQSHAPKQQQSNISVVNNTEFNSNSKMRSPCNGICSSSTDQVAAASPLGSFDMKKHKFSSMDELNEKKILKTAKCSSVVSEMVAMIERNSEIKKFNTLKNMRYVKPLSTKLDPKSDQNLCDDEKIELKSSQSNETLIVDTFRNLNDFENPCTIKNSHNFCTLPRRQKTNSNCTFHTISFEKGLGKKSLGFTIVGGADSPRGALGIFIKSIMPNGQAIEKNQLRVGDELLAVNGQVCHDLTHLNAVKLFKSIRSGEIVLNICRRVFKERCERDSISGLDSSTTSYPPEEVVQRDKDAFQEGVMELWLTSEDTGTYSRDIGTSLPELLYQLVYTRLRV